MASPKMTQAKAIAPALPNNHEAERSVLGGILANNQALLAAQELLEPEDFHYAPHVHIFGHFLALHTAGIPVDLVTVNDRLAQEQELEAIGGTAYLASLVDGMPKISNVEHYAKIVKEKAVLRQIIRMAEAVQLHAFEGETSAAVLEEARSRLNQLQQLQSAGSLRPVMGIVKGNFERLEKIYKEGKNVTGLPTGYSELDKALAGLQPGELTILAARPSCGKSSLAVNIAENVAIRSHQPVALFSLEMSADSLLLRLLASLAKINAHKFRTGHLTKEDWQRIVTALATIAPAPLWIDDSSLATVGEIMARAERVQNEHGLSLVIVDYLQLVASSRHLRSRQEEVADVSRGLKALAKNLGVPVVALSQLTRAPDKEDRAPHLSDLRESGSLEQDSDVVLFIHRPNLYKHSATQEERDEAELIIGKQRNGPTDMVRFVFLSNYTRFEEAVPDMFGEPE